MPVQSNTDNQIFAPQTRSPEELAELFGTNPETGLTDKQRKAALHKFGKNVFRKEFDLQSGKGKAFDSAVTHMVTLLLLLLSVVMYLFQGDFVYLLAMLVSGGVLLAGVVIRGIAGRILRGREKYSALSVQVIRDGKAQKTDSRLLVPGDLIFLEQGNLVPADLRILEDNGELTALETPVSGAKSSVRKSCHLPAKEEEAVSGNMLYAGTLVTSGACMAMVCRTGASTLLWQMRAPKEQYLPPLLYAVRESCRMASLIGLSGAFVLTALGALTDTDLGLLFPISTAVAASSLCDIALSLSLLSFGNGLKKMEDSGLIVRNLDRLSRLARVNTVMCPKEMTFPPKKPRLDSGYAGGKLYSAEEPPAHAMQELLKLSLVCSDYPHSLRPYEAVTLAYLKDKCVPLTELTEEWFRVDTATGADGDVNAVISLNRDHYRVVVKGAPENILARCIGYERDGKEYKLSPAAKKRILTAAESASRNMAYLVAIASGITDEESLRSPFAERRLIFRGFLAFSLSMEVDVAGSVYRASRAGIEAVISTDDPYYTAAGIAKSVGIISHEGEMISSAEISSTDRGMYVLNAGKYKVYLDPTNEQWLDALLLRKQNGHTVLAAGTQENHLPLLKNADISAVSVREKDILRESADLLVKGTGFTVFADGIQGAKMLCFRLRWLLRLMNAGCISLFVCLALGMIGSGSLPLSMESVLLGGVVGNLAIACVTALLPTDRSILQKTLPSESPRQKLRSLLSIAMYGLGNGIALYVAYRLTGSHGGVMAAFLLSQFCFACGCLYEEGAIRRKRFGCRALWILFPCLAAYCGLLFLGAIPFPGWEHLTMALLAVTLWQAAVQAILFLLSKKKKNK